MSEVQATVLVVEDDVIIALMIEDCLRDAGIEPVGPVPSADKAMALAAVTRPKMALLDIQITGPRDGIALAFELHREFGVRSVIASGNCNAGTMARLGPAALGCIQKPFTADELIETVKRAIAMLGPHAGKG